jgi:amino acid transporter
MKLIQPFFQRLKHLVIGGARNPHDKALFHNLSLIAFFAWVGLGADGLSSACYGPEEAFLALGSHPHLSIFVALASAVTIFVISASYKQIIELFPSGGGGYVVASKLLSPRLGMISGCALLVDYVLTITISVASGTDALFSMLPAVYQPAKFTIALSGIFILTVLNLRGVRESVIPLVPIFIVFVLTHVFAVVYAATTHAFEMSTLIEATRTDIMASQTELGLFGMIFLILHAYSMGAGTYTGIEAVSNGLPILREPRVHTAKRTMNYMAWSLAFTGAGLLVAYLLYAVEHQPGKTLNAVLFEHLVASWPGNSGYAFVFVTLLSEAIILYVAAQTGFLGGPRILANMAIDRWFPSRFAMFSDRFVTHNGILIMGGAAFGMLIVTGASVKYLVVLYSINVFLTFTLSLAGMVKHWWMSRSSDRTWKGRILISGTGLIMSAFILVSVVIIKFFQGGWLTVIITGSLILFVVIVRRHYESTKGLLGRLDSLVDVIQDSIAPGSADGSAALDRRAKTAVLLVNGFNGLGLHTLLSIIRLFGSEFKNFVFIQIGIIDAGNFKGSDEMEHLNRHTREELDRYIAFLKKNGYYAEGFTSIGTDVVDEVYKLTPEIGKRFPNAIYFGGQLVFPEDTFLTRWLHNYTVFAIQRKFYQQGIPFVILPIRV